MPRVPSISPATGSPTSSSYIHTIDCNFVDNAGRTLLLRGVNLSGSSKAPVDRPSYILEDFWESAEAGGLSFNGRPLDLDDGSADVHLARLRGWGFNMLRFPVTWEALEHEGPGKYDYDFMDYTIRVLRKCKEYGFKVYMDPHQDIWSRFSGGSGAPFWTLAACGIDPRNLTATQAAIIHAEYPYPHEADPASLPAMIWSTNYGRLLSQTVFTLFFAGRDFAPKCIIDGKNIQDWLQGHYIEAMGKMADRIRDAGDLLEECVIGWDSLNEPFEGLCGWEDLNVSPTTQGSTLRKGTHPTPAESLRLGMGQAQTVENWSFGAFGPSRSGSVTVDPKGRKMWAEPSMEGPDGVHPKWGWKRDPGWALGTCIWAHHGVWDVESGYILRPDYFRYLPPSHPSIVADDDNASEPVAVEFVQDYWKPHWERFSARIRASHPEAIMFIQPPVFAPPPPIEEELLRGRAAYSAHYYDGLTLVTRHWNWFNADALGLLRGKYSSTLQAVKIGEGAIRRSLREQLGMLKADALILGPAYPTIIGEIGTPFDMDDKRSYGWTDGGRHRGDYPRQQKALDASLNAADGSNALNYTVWTYCTDSCHDWGDGWNMEDLSLWSEDDLSGRGFSRGSGRQGVSGNGDSDADLVRTYRNGDASSQVALLRQSKMSLDGLPVGTRAAAASSLSLATLGFRLAGGLPFDEVLAKQQEEMDMIRWKENPYVFLTDGARAVKAFSRPWPSKVVGRPKDISFDIVKTHFKLVVSVRPEDALKPGGVDERLPATEIYVPLVHYAHPRYLATGCHYFDDDGRSQTESVDSNGSRSVTSSGKTSRFESRNQSQVNLPTLPSVAQLSVSQSSEGTVADSVWDAVNAPDLLDLDVKVSAGRFEVHGQMLKWWYDVPADGEADVEYTIEIKRVGGPIKTKQVGEGSWRDQLCPEDRSCLVM